LSSPFDNQFDASNDEAMIIGGKYSLIRSLAPDHLGARALAEGISGHKRVLLRFWPLDDNTPEMAAWLKSAVEAHRQIGKHPNIINLLESIAEQKRFSLVYPEVTGEPFSDWLEYNANSQLDNAWEEGVEYLLQCMDAMSRIHTQGFHHGDLSPATLLISRDDIGAPVTKLPNVGLYAASNKYLCEEESALPFRAPEQLMSENKAICTNATDIYAIGAMLHVLFTGNSPDTSADSNNMPGAGSAFENFKTTGNNFLDDQIKRIILRALAFQPEDRFSSIRTMADTLRSALTEHSSQDVKSYKQSGVANQKLRENLAPMGVHTPGVLDQTVVDPVSGDKLSYDKEAATQHTGNNNTMIIVAIILIPFVMISVVVLAGLAYFQPWNYFTQSGSPTEIIGDQPSDTDWNEEYEYYIDDDDDDEIPDFDSMTPEERERLMPPTPVEQIMSQEEEIQSVVPIEASTSTPVPTFQPTLSEPDDTPVPIEVPPVPQESEPTYPVDDPTPIIELTPISPPMDTWESDAPQQTTPRDRVPERTVAPEGSLTPAAPPVETPAPTQNNFGWGDDAGSDDWEVILDESRRKD